jgi:hypothetical protein
MKKYFILTTTAILLLSTTACNNETKTDKQETPKAVDGVYHFAETSDSKFCSSDSIIPGDCGFGELYLTKKGNAIYNFICMGQDTESYSVGSYVVTDSTITCTFNRDYNYKLDCIGLPGCEDKKPADPNSGKIKGTETWTLDLIKANCKTFQYYILPTKEQQLESKQNLEEAKKGNYDLLRFRGYVLSLLPDKDAKQYVDTLFKIKALSDL